MSSSSTWSARDRAGAAGRSRLRALLAGVGVAGAVTLLAVAPAPVGAAPAPAHNPVAFLEPVTYAAGALSIHGWDFDPDAPKTPLVTDVRIDGVTVLTAPAATSRPDVAKYYASRFAINANHGFAFTRPTTDGWHTVCMTAHNVGTGVNRIPACSKLLVHQNTVAFLEPVTYTPGHLSIHGWGFDPDAPTTPLVTDISVDGKLVKTLTANVSRPDVSRYYASFKINDRHGFTLSQPVTQAPHTVCITVHDVKYGLNRTPACSSFIAHMSPLAQLESATQTPGHLALRGWDFDADAPATPLVTDIKVDGRIVKTLTATASRPDVAARYRPYKATNGHGFTWSQPIADGKHTVCITAHNLSYGTDNTPPCRTVTTKFEPTTAITALTAASAGLVVSGWTSDPDTSAAIQVRLTIDGQLARQSLANGGGPARPGHTFGAALTAVSGTHTVCAVGVNVAYGTQPPIAACRVITLALDPIARYEALTRLPGSTNLKVTGWALDPDTKGATKVTITADGRATVVTASISRPDVKALYPAWGALHGFAVTLPANDGEHTVCVAAVNVSLGADRGLGCRIINAVHPVAPSTPTAVLASAGYGGATVTWTAPASDGGAPISSYVVTSSPGNVTATVAATARSAVVVGLAAKTRYTFRVTARNVVGLSAGGVSAAVTTQPTPPAQTSPAPVSTSRYIRNVRGASAAELAIMRAEGVADAKANPSGHGYLVLLDIGGQDNADGGVLLSATTRFVSYANLVADVNAYVAGYASAQKASAPVVIAVGTNNDMEVTSAAGTAWADRVVDPIAAAAGKFTGITIAGANDIEPGFRGTYAQTKVWLDAYLRATAAPFVFNGSADGCAWTATNRGCNNGWSMAGPNLAAGAAPVRTLNLPQIYNSTMAKQWKYISLTGVAAKQPRINFGGALTEWTACDQASGCFSLTGHSAWSELWTQLQSTATLRVGTLPYSTDLRIDR